ncbi:MAG: thiol-activated cytolysin family protein [Saprospiraceae bacterium]|jgi:hypothetical protein
MKNQKLILSILLLCVFWNSYSQITPGTYIITSKLVNRNLDIKWADKNNGAGLHIWDPNGGEAQKFKIENSKEAGYYQIKSQWNKCLDVNGSAPDKLMVWDCHGGDNQKWKFIDTKDGHYNIQSKLGTYIDVRWAKRDNGSEVGMSAYSTWENNGAQRWKVEKKENGTSNNPGNLIVGNTKLPDPSVFTGKPSYEGPLSRNDKSKSPRYSETNKYNENGFACTSRTVSITESGTERFKAGNIDNNNIYPGVIYKDSDMKNGNFNAVNIDRNPLNLTVSLVSASSGNVNTTITNSNNSITAGSVNQGITSLLRNNRNVGNAARTEFEMKQIFSEEQLKIFVNGSYSGWGANVSATFNFQNNRKKNVYIARVYQEYFTVSVDNFQSLVKKNNSNYSGELVYISSVAYGKIGYIKIESDETFEKVAATLNAKYDAGIIGSVAVEAGFDVEKINRELQVTGFLRGGNPGIYTDIKSFCDNAKDVRWNPNTAIEPIKYRIKFLSDHNDAYVTLTTTYTERICKPTNIGRKFKISLVSGVDALRHYNPAFFKVNFNDGTSGHEMEMFRGTSSGIRNKVEYTLPDDIDLINVKSFTIRFNGSGNFPDGHDNWDLNELSVDFISNANKITNIYTSLNDQSQNSGDKVPCRFSGEKSHFTFTSSYQK